MAIEYPLILVVDDEEAIRESVTYTLEHESYRTITAATGREALKKYKENRPDLVILDIMLPDISGLEVCKGIRNIADVPILFLSAKDQLEDMVEGLDKGGDDYLAKPFHFAELMARVRALLRRSKGRKVNFLEYEDIILDPESHIVTKGGRTLHLTLREFELLEMFMSKPRQVFTRQQILQQLWGWCDDLETNVVEVYICALRNKLDDENRSLLRTVRGVGYVLG
mgnify:FL=1